MNTRIGVWLLVVLTALAGCVPSLNPVFTDKQLRFDPQVVGTWVQSKSKNRWEFTRRDDKSYRLVYTDEKGQQGRFIARLADVDGTHFLDLFPEKSELEVSGFYTFHLVPIHTIYLVKSVSPQLELAAIDYQWLENYLDEHPEAVRYATFNGRKMLTAPTREVQQFVLKHKAMFTGEFELERASEAVN